MGENQHRLSHCSSWKLSLLLLVLSLAEGITAGGDTLVSLLMAGLNICQPWGLSLMPAWFDMPSWVKAVLVLWVSGSELAAVKTA